MVGAVAHHCETAYFKLSKSISVQATRGLRIKAHTPPLTVCLSQRKIVCRSLGSSRLPGSVPLSHVSVTKIISYESLYNIWRNSGNLLQTLRAFSRLQLIVLDVCACEPLTKRSVVHRAWRVCLPVEFEVVHRVRCISSLTGRRKHAVCVSSPRS